jgi:hypothetical protein
MGRMRGRKHDYRFYGAVKGLSEEDGHRLAAELPLDDARFAQGELSFEHEGPFVDLDKVLELLSSSLGPETRGQFDLIDNAEWVLTRHTVSGKSISSRRVDLNDALDRYLYE